MRGVIRGERERGRVALAEPELRERGDLSEDLVGHVGSYAVRARAVDERRAQLLHVRRRPRAAHRAAKLVRGTRREPGDGHRDAQDLLLEEDHAERLLERGLEQRMRVRDRLAALTAVDVRIHHVPLQRARPDDRDLHDDVLEASRTYPRERGRLRAALDLEQTDRVDLADEVVDRLVVERDGPELETLAVPRLDVGHGVLDERQRAQAEEIHLYEAEVLDVALVELHDVAVGHRRALDRHGIHERLRGDEHAAVVDRQVAWEVGDGERELAEEWEARAFLLVHRVRQLLQRVANGPGVLPAVLGLAVRMLVRRVLRRTGSRARVDVVLVDRLRHTVDRLVAEAERLRDLAARGARAIGDDVAHHRRIALAVLLVDVLDDLLAVVRRDIEVDVRHRAAVLGEEPLEEELVLDRIDLGDVEHVRVGDGARVRERLRVPAEAFAQDRLVLHPVLAVRLEPIPRLVERQAALDTAQHVVQTSTFRPRVMDVVRDHRTETLLRCELRERVAQRRIVRIEVVGELDVAALAEDPREP